MNESLLSLFSQPMWVFLAVLARISPPLMMTPPTRSTSVPKRVRAFIAITLAALVAPMAYSSATPMPADLLNIVIGLTGEVVLGILLGSIIMLAFASLQLAGQTVGHLAGYDSVTGVDPSGDEEMPVISSMLGWLAMAIFIIIGGHRQLLDCCMQSFTHYPIGSVYFQTHWLDELDAVMRHTLVIGIRAAAPMATALLLANLVTGLLARTLPQLNVLAIGFNINALAMLTLLSVSMGGMAWVFQSELFVWLESCERMARAGSS
jgi:flagellar biosynthesis protein FliR